MFWLRESFIKTSTPEPFLAKCPAKKKKSEFKKL